MAGSRLPALRTVDEFALALRREALARDNVVAETLARGWLTTWQGALQKIEALLAQPVEGPPGAAARLREVALERTLREQLTRFAAFAQPVTHRAIAWGAELGAAQSQRLVAALEVGAAAGAAAGHAGAEHAAAAHRVPQEAVDKLIGALQEQSALGASLARTFPTTLQRAQETLTRGLAAGDNPRTLALALQHDALASREQAQAIARSELMRAHRLAALENYRANDDVVQGWRWLAAVTERTCIVCLLKNGSVHPLSEEMESHACCRCIAVPVTLGLAELLGLGDDAEWTSSELYEAGLAEALNATEEADRNPYTTLRGVTDGLWLALGTGPTGDGEARFAALPEASQLAVLGPGKWALWQDGQLALDDLVGTREASGWGKAVPYERSMFELGYGPRDVAEADTRVQARLAAEANPLVGEALALTDLGARLTPLTARRLRWLAHVYDRELDTSLPGKLVFEHDVPGWVATIESVRSVAYEAMTQQVTPADVGQLRRLVETLDASEEATRDAVREEGWRGIDATLDALRAWRPEMGGTDAETLPAIVRGVDVALDGRPRDPSWGPGAAWHGGASDWEPLASLAEIEDALHARYPQTVFALRDALGNAMDLELGNAVAKSYDALAQEWPGVAARMLYVGLDTTAEAWRYQQGGNPGQSYAALSRTPLDGGGVLLTFSTTYWKEASLLARMLRADVTSGWLIDGTAGPAQLVAHEFGHAIDMVGRATPGLMAQAKDFLAAVRTDRTLSQYAATDPREMIAEAHAARTVGSDAVRRHWFVATWDAWLEKVAAFLGREGKPLGAADGGWTPRVLEGGKGTGSHGSENSSNAEAGPAHAAAEELAQRRALLEAGGLAGNDAEARTAAVPVIARAITAQGRAGEALIAQLRRVLPDVLTDRDTIATAEDAGRALRVVWNGSWGPADEEERRLAAALRLAAREEFGGGKEEADAAGMGQHDAATAWVRGVWGAQSPALRAVWRAVYDETQATLARAELPALRLWRGVSGADAQRLAAGRFDGIARSVADVATDAATSFTVLPGQARRFAGQYAAPEKGMVAADVPAARVLSLPATGFGMAGEGEVLVLGSSGGGGSSVDGEGRAPLPGAVVTWGGAEGADAAEDRLRAQLALVGDGWREDGGVPRLAVAGGDGLPSFRNKVALLDWMRARAPETADETRTVAQLRETAKTLVGREPGPTGPPPTQQPAERPPRPFVYEGSEVAARLAEGNGNAWWWGGHPGDGMMEDMLREMRLGAAPRAVAAQEFAQAVERDGWRELWRGVTDPAFAQQLRDGTLFVGRSQYGDGLATGVGPEGKIKAEQYQRDGGVLLRLALAPDARVIDFKDAQRLRDERLKVLQARMEAEKPAWGSSEYRALQGEVTLTQDVGRYALTQGYDAIWARGQAEIVVLNQTKAIVEVEGKAPPTQQPVADTPAAEEPLPSFRRKADVLAWIAGRDPQLADEKKTVPQLKEVAKTLLGRGAAVPAAAEPETATARIGPRPPDDASPEEQERYARRRAAATEARRRQRLLNKLLTAAGVEGGLVGDDAEAWMNAHGLTAEIVASDLDALFGKVKGTGASGKPETSDDAWAPETHGLKLSPAAARAAAEARPEWKGTLGEDEYDVPRFASAEDAALWLTAKSGEDFGFAAEMPLAVAQNVADVTFGEANRPGATREGARLSVTPAVPEPAELTAEQMTPRDDDPSWRAAQAPLTLSEEQFQTAQREAFTASETGTNPRELRRTADGETYFSVERHVSPDHDEVRNEMDARTVAYLIGADKHVLPAVSFGDRLVTRYVEGALPLVELAEPEQAILAQGEEWLSKEVVLEYLLGDADRNAGNLMLLPSGHLVGLDFAHAFRTSEWDEARGGGVRVDTIHGVWTFLDRSAWYTHRLDAGILRDALSAEHALLAAVPESYRAKLQRRLAVLRALLDDPDARAEGYSLEVFDAIASDAS